MHPGAYRYVEQALAGLPAPPRRIVEFGGRNINGSVRPLFTGAESYVSVDLIPGPGVDVLADAATYGDDASADCVVCCEVLEHAETASRIVSNALRILRSRGVMIITCATNGRLPHSTVSGGPLPPGEYYRNVSRQDLEYWVTHAGGAGHFEMVVDPTAHDLYCTVVKA